MEGLIFKSRIRHIPRHWAQQGPNLDNCCGLVPISSSDSLSILHWHAPAANNITQTRALSKASGASVPALGYKLFRTCKNTAGWSFLAFHRAGSNEHEYVRSSAQLGWGWIQANTTLKQMPKGGDEEMRGNLQISSHMCRCPEHCSSFLGLAPSSPSLGFTKHLEIPQGQKGKWDYSLDVMFLWQPSRSAAVCLGNGHSRLSWTGEAAARRNQVGDHLKQTPDIVSWVILQPLPWWCWNASVLKLVLLGWDFPFHCFSCQLIGLMAFLEGGTLGLHKRERALESMKKQTNPSVSIPIPGSRRKRKLLKKELMNRPREVRGRTHNNAASLSSRKKQEHKSMSTNSVWRAWLKLGEKIHVPGILKSILVTYLERIE